MNIINPEYIGAKGDDNSPFKRCTVNNDCYGRMDGKPTSAAAKCSFPEDSVNACLGYGNKCKDDIFATSCGQNLYCNTDNDKSLRGMWFCDAESWARN